MTDDLIGALREAHARAAMVGWDFSQLDGRLTADDPWWDFDADCRDAMRRASTVVDLGTGGGERLIDLLDAAAGRVIATEGWDPNVAVARSNLAPHGVEVRRYDAETGERMPFDDGEADLVMSRHEAIDAGEVARVLAPGGRFLTQQVAGSDAPELHEWFDAEVLYPEVNAGDYSANLRAAGLRIDVVDEWEGTMRFTDAAALVTYIGYVPWDVPGFSVDDHADRLVALDAARPIEVTQRRFRIYATKQVG